MPGHPGELLQKQIEHPVFTAKSLNSLSVLCPVMMLFPLVILRRSCRSRNKHGEMLLMTVILIMYVLLLNLSSNLCDMIITSC